MVNYCCVTGCSSRTGDPGIRLHRFPSLTYVRAQWQRLLRVKTVQTWMMVCSEHFTPNDYTSESNIRLKKLQSVAIPTQNLPQALPQSGAGSAKRDRKSSKIEQDIAAGANKDSKSASNKKVPSPTSKRAKIVKQVTSVVNTRHRQSRLTRNTESNSDLHRSANSDDNTSATEEFPRPDYTLLETSDGKMLPLQIVQQTHNDYDDMLEIEMEGGHADKECQTDNSWLTEMEMEIDELRKKNVEARKENLALKRQIKKLERVK